MINQYKNVLTVKQIHNTEFGKIFMVFMVLFMFLQMRIGW